MATLTELDAMKADLALLKVKVLSLETAASDRAMAQEGAAAASVDASHAASSARPPPPPPPQSALSRVGLQGRYEHLLSKERARHVDAAATWLVEKVQAAAAIRLTRLDIDFFSKAAPAPSDCLACETWGVTTKKKYGVLNPIGLMKLMEANGAFGAPASPSQAYKASMNEKVRKIDEELRSHGREVSFSTPDLKAQHERLVMRQRLALLEQKKLFCFTEAVADEGLIALECVEDVVAAVTSKLSDVTVALEAAGSDSPIIRIDWS